MYMLKAIIFDFDGLILETELPEYLAWDEIFHRFGSAFPMQHWIDWVGGEPDVDYLISLLQAQSAQKVDRKAIRSEHMRRFQELVNAQPVLPGVRVLIEKAHRQGLILGVASSSSRNWVEGHLRRLGLIQYFSEIYTKDDVREVKPKPDLYLGILKALKVQPEEAIALEDSPNGLKAAREAGLFCVVVPSPLTKGAVFQGAGFMLSSLEQLSLEELIQKWK